MSISHQTDQQANQAGPSGEEELRASDEHRFKAKKNFLRVVTMRIAFSAVTFLTFIAYARLLDARQFGLMAMASTAITLLALTRDLGWAQSAIQRAEFTTEMRDQLFWMNAIATVLSMLVLFAAAPAIAWFYSEPTLVPVVLASGVYFFAWGIQAQHAANLRRHMRFTPVLWAEGAGMVSGAVVGIVVAYVRRDLWALVAANATQAVVTSTIMFLIDPWLPRTLPHFRGVGHHLSWGRDFVVQSGFSYLSANWGQIIIGSNLGASSLGLYSRALQLFSYSNGMIMNSILEVFSPLLSRLQLDLDAYRSVYLSFLARVTMLFFTLAVLLPVVSEDLIRFLLGDKWTEAAPILAWFAPALAALGITAPTQVALTSQGRIAELRNWSILDFASRAVGATIGLRYGPEGVAGFSSLASLVVAVPAAIWILGRKGAVSWRGQVEALLPSALMAAAAVLAALAASSWLGHMLQTPFLRLLALTGVGFAAAGVMGLMIPMSRTMLARSVRAARPRA